MKFCPPNVNGLTKMRWGIMEQLVTPNNSQQDDIFSLVEKIKEFRLCKSFRWNRSSTFTCNRRSTCKKRTAENYWTSIYPLMQKEFTLIAGIDDAGKSTFYTMSKSFDESIFIRVIQITNSLAFSYCVRTFFFFIFQIHPNKTLTLDPH